MNRTLFFLTAFLILVTSCNKEDFTYSYPEVVKLLLSVTRTEGDAEFRAEFKYDSFNRIIELKNIFQEGEQVIETYKYNDAGQLIEKSIVNSASTYDYHVVRYNYNDAEQLIEEIVQYISPHYAHETKTEFQYKNGKINKGIEYSAEGEILYNISYKYDSRGNTLEKISRVVGSESEFAMIEQKFRYDTKVNPNAHNGLVMPQGYIFSYFPDIKQINNPVYSSYSNMLMSSIPPEYEISYDYDSNGLPVKAIMNNVRFPGQRSVIVEYVYGNKL
jgi:hypothetical protein